MANCDGNCEGCGSAENCPSKGIEKAKLNDRSHIKKIICVLSGKGGVGKSFVTSSLAVYLNRSGYSVGIMDADITGPSIPKAFGLNKRRLFGEDNYLYPQVSKSGIKIVSAGFLLEDESDPIVWRGPMFGSLIQQFYENVLWEDLDYLLIDMPPGTSDVSLSVFQLLPVDELIIVTSPQDLVSVIVTKAIKMANMMNVHTLGIVENMSYLLCPDCGKKISVFGESHVDELAKEQKIPVLAKLPIKTDNTELIDKGHVEMIQLEELAPVVKVIEKENK